MSVYYADPSELPPILGRHVCETTGAASGPEWLGQVKLGFFYLRAEVGGIGLPPPASAASRLAISVPTNLSFTGVDAAASSPTSAANVLEDKTSLP